MKKILKISILTLLIGIMGLSLGAPTEASSSYIASCYSLRGKTASGERVTQGMIAADLRVIPLHSQVEITGAGSFDGTYTVKDTGGAIKGNRIDIWHPSTAACVQFGKKRVTVTVKRRGRK